MFVTHLSLVLIWRYLTCLWKHWAHIPTHPEDIYHVLAALSDLRPPNPWNCPFIHNRSNMASISATMSSSSCFSQGSGPPLPTHQSIEELMSWFSSELYFFLSANAMLAPMVSSTQAGNSQAPEPTRANAHQVHLEGITTLAAATIPFPGCAVPTMVILSAVPLHLGTGQHLPSVNPSPPSLNQGGELSRLPPSRPPEPSHLSVVHPVTWSDITIDPRYDLEYSSTPDGFPIVPQNSLPRTEESQPPGHGDPIQEPMPKGTPAVVTASPGVTVCPPFFNQTLGAYLAPSQPLSSSRVKSGDIPPAHTNPQSEDNRQSTFRQLLGQTYQANTTVPIRGPGVNQHVGRHKCTICDASYTRLSGLNRHYKDKHLAWMPCRRCNSEFSLGRMYKFTEHLQSCPGA
ncbi:hypothetical protein EI94DRAFT_1312021 [Lactarius quietus]|nr:hypothetical protein EI94DRAFT_1312021 [Lactarius quietus]